MREYLRIDEIKEILNDVDGECVPLVFIDHIDVFYRDGSVKSVDGDKIRSLFPEVKRTTMGILKNNGDVVEINVKVDMTKIHKFMNTFCCRVQERVEHVVSGLINKKSG